MVFHCFSFGTCSDDSQHCFLEVYHTRTVSKAGRPGWQGGKDLASSAAFTWSFCLALLQAWQHHVGRVHAPRGGLANIVLLSDDDSDAESSV